MGGVAGLPGGRLETSVGDEEVDAATFDVEGDLVAGVDDGKRAADGGFGCDVEDDGAKGGAGHAGVGDADHVLDAGAGKSEGDGEIAGFGHTGCAFGAGVAEDEDVVCVHVEIG